ncbi:GmrSD restriction endonuclease domain-containing protein [Rhodanobacter umsongensis]
MTILQQSSKAQDRSLGHWYSLIQSGQLKLPRFQRMEAWDRGRVTGFLNTIIQNLPVGVTLLLEVGDKEKFVSRYIASAPETGARVTEHLLDGQQRLTAFWRAMHNNYEGETYFVYLSQFDRNDQGGRDADEVRVVFEGRWKHKDTWRPIWVDSPKSCLERGLIPVDLLCPGDQSVRVSAWVEEATAHLKPTKGAPDFEELFERLSAMRQSLRDAISNLRERVTHFNLPYLALPVSTDAKVALTVFVNMNTNSKPLSMFDLTVAMVEEEAGASLHDLQDKLEAAHPEITHYGDLASPLLQVGALLQGLMPNMSGINGMDKQQLVKDWPRVERAMVRASSFLVRQQIYDERRLPSNVVLPVLAASLDAIPEDGDALGRGEHLLRAYFWSAVFTSRYEGAAATRSFQDYKALLTLLRRTKFDPADYASVPVMDRRDYELPNFEQLTRVGWPKGSDRMARAILATTLYFGGWDFADGRPASYEALKTREYHHIFPDALLQEADIESNLALNCALITAKTNRTIGRKDPLDYLKDRVQWAGEDAVRARLKTHLLDYTTLAGATYADADGNPLMGNALAARLKPDFAAFLEQRAKLVALTAAHLASGEQPSYEALMAEAMQDKQVAA